MKKNLIKLFNDTSGGVVEWVIILGLIGAIVSSMFPGLIMKFVEWDAVTTSEIRYGLGAHDDYSLHYKPLDYASRTMYPLEVDIVMMPTPDSYDTEIPITDSDLIRFAWNGKGGSGFYELVNVTGYNYYDEREGILGSPGQIFPHDSTLPTCGGLSTSACYNPTEDATYYTVTYTIRDKETGGTATDSIRLKTVKAAKVDLFAYKQDGTFMPHPYLTGQRVRFGVEPTQNSGPYTSYVCDWSIGDYAGNSDCSPGTMLYIDEPTTMTVKVKACPNPLEDPSDCEVINKTFQFYNPIVTDLMVDPEIAVFEPGGQMRFGVNTPTGGSGQISIRSWTDYSLGYLGREYDKYGSYQTYNNGSFTVIAEVCDDVVKDYCVYPEYSFNVSRPPNTPLITAVDTGQFIGGNHIIRFSAFAEDPDGDPVTYEWGYQPNQTGAFTTMPWYGTPTANFSSGDASFSGGLHTVRVRACDPFGLCSDWVTFDFNTQDVMKTIFETWVNYPNDSGKWRYVEAGKYIQSTENVGWTGFWNPDYKVLTNYRLNFDMAVLDLDNWEDNDSIGMTFRMQDENNFYFLAIDRGGYIGPGLFKKVNGTQTELVNLNGWNWSFDNYENITIEVNGNNIKVWRGNVLKVDINDNTFSSGAYGPWTASQAYGTFKNLRLEFIE